MQNTEQTPRMKLSEYTAACCCTENSLSCHWISYSPPLHASFRVYGGFEHRDCGKPVSRENET